MSDDTSDAETDGDRSGGGGESNGRVTGDVETSGDVDEEEKHQNCSEAKNIARSPNQSSINRLLRESSKYDLGRSLN